jgi:(R,R)-butanediol dehydrogenase / meso-butanediol dehydrogenase / diacetyl reductase
MKAARFHARGDIRIDDVPEPAVRPGTVKVEVEWCGICGTDLHEYLEGPIFTPPARLTPSADGGDGPDHAGSRVRRGRGGAR